MEEETVLYGAPRWETGYPMDIEELISVLTKYKNKGYTKAKVILYGEGACGGGADADLIIY